MTSSSANTIAHWHWAPGSRGRAALQRHPSSALEVRHNPTSPVYRRSLARCNRATFSTSKHGEPPSSSSIAVSRTNPSGHALSSTALPSWVHFNSARSSRAPYPLPSPVSGMSKKLPCTMSPDDNTSRSPKDPTFTRYPAATRTAGAAKGVTTCDKCSADANTSRKASCSWGCPHHTLRSRVSDDHLSSSNSGTTKAWSGSLQSQDAASVDMSHPAGAATSWRSSQLDIAKASVNRSAPSYRCSVVNPLRSPPRTVITPNSTGRVTPTASTVVRACRARRAPQNKELKNWSP